MAIPAGFKTFVAGEVLTADQVNTFLMSQSIPVFASEAVAGSAIASPSTRIAKRKVVALAVRLAMITVLTTVSVEAGQV